MFPLKEAILSFAEEIKQIEAEKENALTDAQNKADALTAMTQQKNAADKALEAERQALAKAVIVNRELSEQLQARPVIGITRKPTITKTDMRDVAGVAIPKGNAPGAVQDQNARDMMLLWAMMGGNAWRGFFNLSEVKAHVVMADSNVNHLPGFGRKLGLTFIADTVNNAALNLSDNDLDAYIAGLLKMGAAAFYFDDANQYREARNADGTPKYPADKLETMVARIRKRAPNTPLIASLTSNAVIANYKDPKTLFDFVEAQTFGKIGELTGMLGKGFDVYCLDGRKEISLDYLTKAVEIIAQHNPKNVFYYVTAITDWKGMPNQLPLIKQAANRWMSMAR